MRHLGSPLRNDQSSTAKSPRTTSPTAERTWERQLCSTAKPSSSSVATRLICCRREHSLRRPSARPTSAECALLRSSNVSPTSRQLLGAGMNAYYGGRAECRIRKVPLPVVYVDFLSMYPTANALMGIWDLIVAEQVETPDVTNQVRNLLSTPDLLDKLWDQDFWPQLRCLVQIQPDGDIVPVRAMYDEAAQNFGIGINPFFSEDQFWYSLPDLVASLLLGGPIPNVLRAVELRPAGQQEGLVPISLRGSGEIDPREGDFFKAVIERRAQVRKDDQLDEVERERLQKFSESARQLHQLWDLGPVHEDR